MEKIKLEDLKGGALQEQFAKSFEKVVEKLPISNLIDALRGMENDFLAWIMNMQFDSGESRFSFDRWLYSTEIVQQMCQSDYESFAKLAVEYLRDKVRTNMLEGRCKG